MPDHFVFELSDKYSLTISKDEAFRHPIQIRLFDGKKATSMSIDKERTIALVNFLEQKLLDHNNLRS